MTTLQIIPPIQDFNKKISPFFSFRHYFFLANMQLRNKCSELSYFHDWKIILLTPEISKHNSDSLALIKEMLLIGDVPFI